MQDTNNSLNREPSANPLSFGHKTETGTATGTRPELAAGAGGQGDRLPYRRLLKKTIVWTGALLAAGVATAATLMWLLFPS